MTWRTGCQFQSRKQVRENLHATQLHEKMLLNLRDDSYMKIKLVLIALAAAAIVSFFSIVLIKNNKELDKEGALAAQHDFLPAIQMKNEVLLEANEAQNEYYNKLAGIESGEYHMAGDLAAQLELHTAVRKSQQDLAEAEKNLALAKVDEEKALGRISESVAVAKKVLIEKQYVLDQAIAEEKFYKQKIADYDDAIAKGIQNRKDLSTKKDEAQKKFDAVETRRAQITKDSWDTKNPFAQTLEDLTNEMAANETAISNAQNSREELIDTQKLPSSQ
jgi:hypothetical protein